MFGCGRVGAEAGKTSEQHQRWHRTVGERNGGIASRAHRGGSYRWLPASSGGCLISCGSMSGGGEPCESKAVCPSQWTAGEDRQAGCVGVGSLWKNDATQ